MSLIAVEIFKNTKASTGGEPFHCTAIVCFLLQFILRSMDPKATNAITSIINHPKNGVNETIFNKINIPRAADTVCQKFQPLLNRALYQLAKTREVIIVASNTNPTYETIRITPMGIPIIVINNNTTNRGTPIKNMRPQSRDLPKDLEILSAAFLRVAPKRY